MNEDIMRQAGLGEHVDLVKKGICPFCKEVVNPNDFKDELSKKEWGISGLCFKCQKDFFG